MLDSCCISSMEDFLAHLLRQRRQARSTSWVALSPRCGCRGLSGLVKASRMAIWKRWVRPWWVSLGLLFLLGVVAVVVGKGRGLTTMWKKFRSLSKSFSTRACIS